MLTGPVVVYGDEAVGGKKGRERMLPGFFKNLERHAKIRVGQTASSGSLALAANGRGLTLRDSATAVDCRDAVAQDDTRLSTLERKSEEGDTDTGYSVVSSFRVCETRDTMRVLQGRVARTALPIVDHPAYPKSDD